MHNSLIQELVTIFKAIHIMAPTAFRFAGRSFSLNDTQWQHHSGQAGYQNALKELLQAQLYHYCFCQKYKEPLEDLPVHAQNIDEFLHVLSQANTSTDRWDPGWTIHNTGPDGQVFAHKAGKTRGLWPGEYLSEAGPGIRPREGMSVNIQWARESRNIQSGFYFAFGETISDQQEDNNIVRFYWNVTSQGAPELIRSVTHHLNRFHVPFRIKCLNNPAAYQRLDPAVLYVSKQYYHITAQIVHDVYTSMRDYLEPEVPLFALELAPGLSFAEDPGQNESFGMHRCRILAESITNAYARGLQSADARLAELHALFNRHHMSIEQPYMNAASSFPYEFPEYLPEPVSI